jgi:MFS superfamily sulfate permease-like transporter
MQQKEQYAEQAADIASKVQYTGAGGAAFFGLTLNELGVLVGIVIAILGFLVNWYYKHQAFLMRAEHANRRNRRKTDPKYFMPEDSED